MFDLTIPRALAKAAWLPAVFIARSNAFTLSLTWWNPAHLLETGQDVCLFSFDVYPGFHGLLKRNVVIKIANQTSLRLALNLATN